MAYFENDARHDIGDIAGAMPDADQPPGELLTPFLAGLRTYVPLPPPRSVPWTGRQALLGLLVAILVQLAAGGAFAAASRVVRIDVSVVLLLASAIWMATVWEFAVRRPQGSWRVFPFRRVGAGAIGRALLALPVIAAANMVNASLLSLLRVKAEQPVAVLFRSQPSASPVLAFAALALAAPIAEEVFFRGFLYAGLRDMWGIRTATWVSALLFATIHFAPGVFLPLFVLGILFARLVERYQSLWPSIGLHVTINAFAFWAMMLARQLAPHAR